MDTNKKLYCKRKYKFTVTEIKKLPQAINRMTAQELRKCVHVEKG